MQAEFDREFLDTFGSQDCVGGSFNSSHQFHGAGIGRRAISDEVVGVAAPSGYSHVSNNPLHGMIERRDSGNSVSMLSMISNHLPLPPPREGNGLSEQPAWQENPLAQNSEYDS